ncbi:glycosyltransferase family 2 protein [Phycisphaeraceae bacterium D3-23]
MQNANQQTGKRTMLSIVMPCHNEQEVLPETYKRTTAFGQTLVDQGMDYEIVFVNDGSKDQTGQILDRFTEQDTHIRVVHLTRNFGHQPAVTAGLTVARGDAVALLDADLQDPPEVLADFLDKWREGYQVVYAVRKKRKEWFGKRLAYWAFYRLFALISELDMPLDSGDFCLLDRSAVDLLNGLPERQRFVRGLRTWIGLKQTGVAYERDARQAGQPSYTFRSLLRLASDGMVSFSVAPLRLTTRLGIFGVVCAIGLGIWVLIVAFSERHGPQGWASLACLILFLSSIQLISLGIIGEYMARIFLEVKGRPTFLIGRIEGGENESQSESPQAMQTPEQQPIDQYAAS